MDPEQLASGSTMFKKSLVSTMFDRKKMIINTYTYAFRDRLSTDQDDRYSIGTRIYS